MDAKDMDDFSAIVEKFMNSDGSAGAAAEILNGTDGADGKAELENAISKMFATIDAAVDLEQDIDERGSIQALGDSERADTDAGKEEVAAATVEVLNALGEES